MSIAQTRMSEMFGSVCKIYGEKQGHLHGGHGVFVAPDIVLTSWHVLQGKKGLLFENMAGETARMVRGSPFNKKRADLDIATVELDRPLTRDVATFSPDEVNFLNQKGYLVHAFNGRPDYCKAEISKAHYLEEVSGKAKIRTFRSSTDVGPGYSGSPVFDSKGKLVSVLCSGPEERGGAIFCGPETRSVTNFLRDVLFQPE